MMQWNRYKQAELLIVPHLGPQMDAASEVLYEDLVVIHHQSLQLAIQPQGLQR